MEQNLPLPVMTKRVWGIVRVIFFMLRKGISKRKHMVDLNMMLKRGNKIASKAIGNLMFHRHHHDHRSVSNYPIPPCEYEFSCSNTPTYTLPFHSSKRRNHHHQSHHNSFFACAFHAPPTKDDDTATMNAVKLALEMLNNNEAVLPVEASPMLPGFGMSPMVRQLRITDSPFPLRDVDDDNGFVDKKAEEFIEKFYKELRQQGRMSD